MSYISRRRFNARRCACAIFPRKTDAWRGDHGEYKRGRGERSQLRHGEVTSTTSPTLAKKSGNNETNDAPVWIPTCTNSYARAKHRTCNYRILRFYGSVVVASVGSLAAGYIPKIVWKVCFLEGETLQSRLIKVNDVDRVVVPMEEKERER